ncbi:MAG: NnrS family protein [Planctomycetota bacterium]
MDVTTDHRRPDSPAVMSPAPRRQPCTSQAHDAVCRPFFLSAIGIVLTAGAAWGALLLWKLGASQSFTGVTVYEVNAQDHAQFMGWVGLSIMGVSYQLFPRVWGAALPAPRLTWVALVLMLMGTALRSTAMMYHGSLSAPSFQLLGIALELAAVLLFVGHLAWARHNSPAKRTPDAAFMLTAMAFLFIQSLYSGWHTYRLMVIDHRGALLQQIATYQAPLYDMQAHGFAVMMLFAVALRMFPVMFGLPMVPARRAWIAWGLMLGAVVLEVAFFLMFQWTGQHAFAGMLLLPWLMLPAAALVLVLRWGLWRRTPTPHRSAKFIRAALAWLLVSYTMLLLLPVYLAVSKLPFSHAYYGAIRHAFTVGFVSMMIVGMLTAIVQRLRGANPAELTALWPTFILLNLGCALRVSLQVGTDWQPWCFKLVWLSGALEWCALALWGWHMARLMLRRQGSLCLTT